MTRIVGVNGIASDGSGSTDLVLARMRELGLETVDVRLPKRHWISARWGARHDASIIAELTEDGDILLAHSYGAVRAHFAHRIREYKAIFCIAPAASKNLEWRNAPRVFCYYSPDDWAVRIGSWLPWHPFGRAGNEGFEQLDLHGHNYKVNSDHDDFFSGDLLDRIVAHVERVARM